MSGGTLLPNESVEIRDEQEESHQESSASVRGRKQTGNRGRGRTEGFVTQETFAAEMGKLQETLNALLAQRVNEVSVSKEKSEDKVATEVAESLVTAMGSHPQSGPIVSAKAVIGRGCSFKEFAACKPPSYKGECDPVVALRWIKSMELAFDMSKCAEDDKVVYVLSMLKDEAVMWWDVESGGQGSAIAKEMVWRDFVKVFKAQFCPLASVKKLEK
ncbi:hypothetical protein L6452_13651 [Arctium lappa]|uniref:Uncharacterized protein n=1 Tax=Arctium lappa TaxID=4217 RepID=A0ACB9CJ69_ARCLA|nr:hypothetical protein L6452_13651 [Arctium lappa]